MATIEQITENIRAAADLIRKYDDAAKRVIESWEKGDLAEAVRELERVYRREA